MCVYLRMRVHVCEYVWVCMCVYVRMGVHVCAGVACVCVCVSGGACIYMYACESACVHACACVCVRTDSDFFRDLSFSLFNFDRDKT